VCCYSAPVRLAIWLLWLLGAGITGTLVGQDEVREIEIPEDAKIPEGARKLKTKLIYVDGEAVKKETWQIVLEAPNPRTRVRMATVDVKNDYGSVRVVVRAVPEPLLRTRIHGRRPSADDFTLTRDGVGFNIVANPPDGARVDLELTIPYRRLARIETTDGDISYNGFGRAELKTDTGAVSLRFPEELTSFDLRAARAPGEFHGDADLRCSGTGWAVCDQLPEWRDLYGRVTLHPYGRVTLRADRPRAVRLELTEMLPKDSPIQPHWRAAELLPELFRFARKGLRDRDLETGDKKPVSEATFSADVRLVQLEVAAVDRDGRPAADLTPEDFEVFENGKQQQLVEDVSSAAAPFNLVLLLDCSSSTEEDRPAIEEAARRFIGTARPGDKVAVYALAETYFQILSPLTEDHEAAKASVEGIERFGGATPLYDAIVLAYAQELAARPRERNAIIVLSDGLDNEIYSQTAAQDPYWNQPPVTRRRLGSGAPSAVTFEDLRRAVQEMRALLYPVLLDPLRSGLRGKEPRLDDVRLWARTVRRRSSELAESGGGALFEADSAADLDEVYEQVARELRSVYTLAYRPSDQDFNGKWRRVRVRSKQKGIAVRTRPGYYAY